MGINKAREIVNESRLKIMELPYFDQKLDIVSALLELEWKLKEEKKNEYIYEDEVVEDAFGYREEPWSE